MRSSPSSKLTLFTGIDGGNFWMIGHFHILSLNSSARRRQRSTAVSLVVPSDRGKHIRLGSLFVLRSGPGGHMMRIDRRRVSSRGSGRLSNAQPVGNTW